MKIIDLQKKLDMNDDDDELRRLIEEEEEKLRDLEQNIDNVVIEKVNPYNYISVTRDANDNIVILNKSEEVIMTKNKNCNFLGLKIHKIKHLQ